MSDSPLLQEGLERLGAELRSSVGPQRVENAGVAEDIPRGVDELLGQGVLSQVLDELTSGAVVDRNQELVTSVVAEVHRHLLERSRRCWSMTERFSGQRR